MPIETITLTTAHAASSYGLPVALIDGQLYGPAEMTSAGLSAAELVHLWAQMFALDNPSYEYRIQVAIEVLAGTLIVSTEKKPATLAGWLTILLELLQHRTDKEDYRATLQRLQASITTRLETGTW